MQYNLSIHTYIYTQCTTHHQITFVFRSASAAIATRVAQRSTCAVELHSATKRDRLHNSKEEQQETLVFIYQQKCPLFI